jgi:poly(beta-D-mannuronate) lyase
LQVKTEKPTMVNYHDVASIKNYLSKTTSAKLLINLTSPAYEFNEPLFITKDVQLTTNQKTPVKFMGNNAALLFEVIAGNSLSVKNIDIHFVNVNDFMYTDTSGSSNHSSFSFHNATFSNLNGSFFTASKSAVAASIVVAGCTFNNLKGLIFNFTNETNQKGYYNVEKISILNCRFTNCSGQIISMVRGGNDESTMGPYLLF